MSGSGGPTLHEFWGDLDKPLPQIGRKFKVGGMKISGGWSGVQVSIGGRKGVGVGVGPGGISGRMGGVSGTLGGFGSRFGGSRFEGGLPGIEPIFDPFPDPTDQPAGLGGRPRGKFDPPDGTDDDEGDKDDDEDGYDDDREPPEPEWEPPPEPSGGGTPGGGGAG